MGDAEGSRGGIRPAEISLYDNSNAIRVLRHGRRKSWAAYFEEIEAEDIRLHRADVATSPCIDAKMVMVVLPRQETRLTGDRDHQIHAQVLIKGPATLQVS